MQLKKIARKPRPKAPMEELDRAMISVVAGLEGDCRGKPGNRQVTVLSFQSWSHVCDEVGATLPWLMRRANLLIDGFEFLPTDVGRHLQIGTVILEITRETDPCQRMEQQHAGLFEAMLPSWRGGVCCRVIQGGEVSIDSPVTISA